MDLTTKQESEMENKMKKLLVGLAVLSTVTVSASELSIAKPFSTAHERQFLLKNSMHGMFLLMVRIMSC